MLKKLHYIPIGIIIVKTSQARLYIGSIHRYIVFKIVTYTGVELPGFAAGQLNITLQYHHQVEKHLVTAYAQK